jgi:hypothetical protein
MHERSNHGLATGGRMLRVERRLEADLKPCSVPVNVK